MPERLAYANEILPEIKDSAENPLEGKGWWKGAEDKWQALACCIEITNALKHPDPSGFISHLPVHQVGNQLRLLAKALAPMAIFESVEFRFGISNKFFKDFVIQVRSKQG